MINVNKPFLPEKDAYLKYINGIWDRNWLTNHGPLVNELELQLKKYLNVPYLLYLSNGTVALQIAIKAFDLKGEIITTPFSYVATTSSIVWEGCTPVFADIDEHTYNIDPAKIERLINENTVAILATHVFGNPCEVDRINELAKKYNLKVIYDAAHAFGVKVKGKSVFEFGDISTTSFHATKLFHTIEGGAVFTMEPDVLKKMALLRNFGHETAETFGDIGINAKNSEFHAAMGLCNLEVIDEILNKRKELFAYYNEVLAGLKVKRQTIAEDVEYNYSYYPVLFETNDAREKAIQELQKHYIYPRRYFYPSLDTLHYVNGPECEISRSISERIMCLPLYHTLTHEEINLIARILLRTQNN